MYEEDWPISRSERPFVPLSNYLKTLSPDEDAVLSFEELERLVGRGLPPNARTDEMWWESVPRRPHCVAWLRVDRRAHADLAAETVTFRHEVFLRNNPLEAIRAQRVMWADYAWRCLSREDVPGQRDPHVQNGYWEPNHVYLLHLASEGMYKVGVARIGGSRIAELSVRGVTVVDRIQVANQWAAKVVEFNVLELAGEAWVRPHRFSTGRKGETERWLDWLKPPALADLAESLHAARGLPCWNVSVYRRPIAN